MAEHFWQSFAHTAGITLHVRLREGQNTNHIVEASFKGVARCLRDAVRIEGGGVLSTKGVICLGQVTWTLIAVIASEIANPRYAQNAPEPPAADARLPAARGVLGRHPAEALRERALEGAEVGERE